MFSKSLKDFFLSFGIMLFGVGLLFVGSVSFVPTQSHISSAVTLPQSAPRQTLLVGGDYVPEVLPVSHPNVPLPKLDKKDFNQEFTAPSVLVVDNRTDTELFSKNSDLVRPLASITKLISALVILDSDLDFTTTTIIGEEDDLSSSHFINLGEKYTADDLWHMALIGSSNGSINTLARLTGMTHFEFARAMNTKAKELRLNTMRFVEPTGLDAGNVGSARDVARLLKFALSKDKIYNTVLIGEYYARPIDSPKPRRVWSTNWLLTRWIPSRFDGGEIVGKTGFINDSGYNFTVRIGDGGMATVRVVVLGSSTNESRFTEARDLADYAFENYLWPDEDGYGDLSE